MGRAALRRPLVGVPAFGAGAEAEAGLGLGEAVRRAAGHLDRRVGTLADAAVDLEVDPGLEVEAGTPAAR